MPRESPPEEDASAAFRREKEVDALERLRDLVEQKRDEAKGAPSIKHFEVLDELGTGNYSTIYKVQRKADGEIFALKLVEKAQVDKIKKRHPNVHNEVKMEKRALHKLQDGPQGSHQNIIRLHATFQDYYTLHRTRRRHLRRRRMFDHVLAASDGRRSSKDAREDAFRPRRYYLEELCAGGEMWAQTLSADGKKAGIPVHNSLARCWIAELVDAVEHVHKCGLVHRLAPASFEGRSGGRGAAAAGRTIRGPAAAGRTARGPAAAGRTARGPAAAGRTIRGAAAAGARGAAALGKTGLAPPPRPGPGRRRGRDDGDLGRRRSVRTVRDATPSRLQATSSRRT